MEDPSRSRRRGVLRLASVPNGRGDRRPPPPAGSCNVKPEGTIPLELYPIELRNARRFIADHHSHAGEPRAWRFGVGVLAGGELVGVGIAARPKAGGLDSGRALEITRVATIGTPNACSRIYAALCRAGGALGYVEAWTYTLEGECAVCPRAAGFVESPP